LRSFNKGDVGFNAGIEGDIACFYKERRETLHDYR
jgi:hypothetical protein